MRPGSAVIEILLRQGFPSTTDYHQADYANLARFFGLRYYYYDPLALWRDGKVAPRGVKIYGVDVMVDSEELADAVACAFREAVRAVV